MRPAGLLWDFEGGSPWRLTVANRRRMRRVSAARALRRESTASAGDGRAGRGRGKLLRKQHLQADRELIEQQVCDGLAFKRQQPAQCPLVPVAYARRGARQPPVLAAGELGAALAGSCESSTCRRIAT